ncbi:hypothetical protein KUTeg_011360 [Tegillarca granosa]|uniref:Uncharacterized protein n=1 Tax=Tegillarca granosa TaxID=220873 RepID=A0ABQ9F119_TEGGR|nr:hypothetical protein KUTeg_011360 [Tegillarca granosa]
MNIFQFNQKPYLLFNIYIFLILKLFTLLILHFVFIVGMTNPRDLPRFIDFYFITVCLIVKMDI